MFNIIKSKDQKIKIRSTKELEIRKYEFLSLCKILDNLKIKYFLLGGVLLGAIREKSFIPWDWDVEICVYSEEIIPKVDRLLLEISKTEFVIIKYIKKHSSFKIDLCGKLKSSVTKYTIMGWCHDKKKGIFWRNTLKIPDHFIINMKKIEFYNKHHFAPYPPKNYLSHQYGNWEKPMQTSNKYKYLTKKYYGRNVFIDQILKALYFIKKSSKIFFKLNKNK